MYPSHHGYFNSTSKNSTSNLKNTSQSQHRTVKLATRKAVPATHAGGAPPAEQQKMTLVAVKKPCSREELPLFRAIIKQFNSRLKIMFCQC